MRRLLLLVVITLSLAMTVAQAQGNSAHWSFFLGGFGSFTHFGTQLEQFPVIGFFPSPIFSKTVYMGTCFGGGLGPTCGGISFEATESIHPDRVNPGQLQVDGTLTRSIGDGNGSVFGTYVCHSTSGGAARTWQMECQVTITGGTGNYLNATGFGQLQRTMQLFPTNSLSVVELSNWSGSVTVIPNVN